MKLVQQKGVSETRISMVFPISHKKDLMFLLILTVAATSTDKAKILMGFNTYSLKS